MKLNKTTSFVLIHLLNGADSAADVSNKMPSVTIRSIQRILVRLTEMGIIERYGVTDPKYTLQYKSIVSQAIDVKLLENIERPESTFNFAFLEWLENQDLATFKKTSADELGRKISKKELEHLTIELSWKSSALEGNTYTLLDTQLLLQDGIKAKQKTNFETQMILNHKNAITFIVDNPELFTDAIAFGAVEELHRLIGFNLGIDTGVRRRTVKISASNYQPISSPHKIRENADSILGLVSAQKDPFLKALLALSLVPYLQPFEDGNKRTGRLLANAILIHSIGRGFSLRGVEAKQLALAYLALYEFNSLAALSKILRSELSQ